MFLQFISVKPWGWNCYVMFLFVFFFISFAFFDASAVPTAGFLFGFVGTIPSTRLGVQKNRFPTLSGPFSGILGEFWSIFCFISLWVNIFYVLVSFSKYFHLASVDPLLTILFFPMNKYPCCKIFFKGLSLYFNHGTSISSITNYICFQLKPFSVQPRRLYLAW